MHHCVLCRIFKVSSNIVDHILDITHSVWLQLKLVFTVLLLDNEPLSVLCPLCLVFYIVLVGLSPEFWLKLKKVGAGAHLDGTNLDWE